jgi:signal transduction histidine kinase
MRRLAAVWPRVALWAPPLVLGGFGLFEIWVSPVIEPPPSFPGPAGIHTLGVLLVIAGLAVRRRAPGVALAAVLADLLLEWAYGPDVVSLTAFAGALVAFYSVGAHCEPRGAIARLGAGLLVLVGIDVAELIDDGGSFVDTAGEYPFVLVAWGAGVGIRSLRTRAGRLEHRVGALALERDLRAREAAERERTRIARELHDVVAHSVSTMVVQTSGARQVLRSHPEDADDAMRSVEITGRQALRELRRMLGILRTDDRPSLDPQPGIGEVAGLVEHMRDAGLPVELEIRGTPPALAPGFDLAAYRIVQEALTNVLKHAGPVHTDVQVAFDAGAMELLIHNAAPNSHSTADRADPGHGLIGMRERVLLYGGTVDAAPDEDGGFTVLARLPLESERT